MLKWTATVICVGSWHLQSNGDGGCWKCFYHYFINWLSSQNAFQMMNQNDQVLCAIFPS